MGRLPVRERIIATALFVLWAAAFATSMQRVWLDAGLPSIIAAPPSNADDYPTLRQFRFRGAEANPQLRIGDRLLRVGDADLRGVGPLAVFIRASSQAGESRSVRLDYERKGETRTTALALTPARAYWGVFTASLIFALAALLALRSVAPSPVVRVGIPALLLFAIELGSFTSGTTTQTVFVLAMNMLASCLDGPLLLRAVMLFPHERAPRSPWVRHGVWLLALRGPLGLAAGFGAILPVSIGLVGASLLLALALGCMLIALTRNYRAADAIGRRQLRWLLFTVYLGGLPMLVTLPFIVLDPSRGQWVMNVSAAAAIAPIGLLIGTARYNWFDVDRLLTATVSYNVLAFLVAGGALVALPPLADALSNRTNVDSGAAQTALTLLLVGAAIPAQRRLRPSLERVFFPERHAVDERATALLLALSDGGDPQALTHLLGEGLTEVFRPEACVIYAPIDDHYAPVYCHGSTAAAAFAARSPLLETLRGRRTPLALGSDRSDREPTLDPFDRAVLETLAAVVVLPIVREELPALIVCIGAKRSGDVFTSTDLQLLTALGEKVSSELARFDQAKVLAESRAMQDALRRYVPGAVADELARGEDLAQGERAVSVLFVDIRGYSGLAEGRAAEEIFSTINRYTETVSEIVHANGGSIVEFNGDGMMAVFGAPRELAAKERSAVTAGRALFEAAARIDLGGSDLAGSQHISVGVGIATGDAFVGNIQAVDRMIWSAIGHTTNLAARMQALTRELDAAVVIDAATRDAMGETPDGFAARENVAIRGMRHHATVYVLPLRESR